LRSNSTGAKSLIIAVLLAFSSTAVSFAAQDKQYALKLYDKITAVVRDEFYDGRARTPEFRRAITRYRERVTNREQAIAAARSVIAKLGDPYSWLLDQNNIERREVRQSGVKRLPPMDITVKLHGQELTRRVPVITEKLAVKASWLDPETGYLVISDFDNKLMPQQLQRAVSAMKFDSAKYLIVDLRGNSGGFISSAAQALGFLMGSAQNIATLHTAHGDKPLNLNWPPSNPRFSGKLAVLVNGGTGSASELVAAAVQKRKRGLIVGQRTAGSNLWKGDRVIEPGLVLYLSFAQWTIQPEKFEGVVPDIIVKHDIDRDSELKAAERAMRD
jgi:C-terminal processing protease CtpA/Prc